MFDYVYIYIYISNKHVCKYNLLCTCIRCIYIPRHMLLMYAALQYYFLFSVAQTQVRGRKMDSWSSNQFEQNSGHQIWRWETPFRWLDKVLDGALNENIIKLNGELFQQTILDCRRVNGTHFNMCSFVFFCVSCFISHSSTHQNQGFEKCRKTNQLIHDKHQPSMNITRLNASAVRRKCRGSHKRYGWSIYIYYKRTVTV